MQDRKPGVPPLRQFEKRRYRHRQLYWRAFLPITVLLVVGYASGYLLESIAVAILAVLVVILVQVREVIEVLGYLGYVQRDAAEDREAIRKELNGLKDKLRPPN